MAFDSPKRKRPDNGQCSSLLGGTVPLLTTLSPRQPESPDEGGASPRSTVTGKFQRLSLSHSDYEDYPTGQRPSKRPHYSGDDLKIGSFQQSQQLPEPAPSSASASASTPASTSAVAPTTATSSTIGRAMSTVYDSKGESSRPRSPSLKAKQSDQFWHESEITGLDPDDPDDDGYGINGIGFKPTSAIAYARTQKRKQQVAEYRSREAKEARQRRSERRRQGMNSTRSASPPAPLSSPDTPRKTRVRFQDCFIDASG